MRPMFFVVDAAVGRETVSVRAYTRRGGVMLANLTFPTYAEAIAWIG